MMRTFVRRTLLLLFPTLALLCAVGVGGSQQTPQNLFEPVYEIYDYVQYYFYKPELIDDQEVLYGAMKGLVQELGDPYSEFLEPDEYQQFIESLEGEFSGVGIEISIEDGILTVIAPLVGTPAEAAGIQAGDQILAIDGEPTDGMTLSQAGVRIRGEIGTQVTLTVRHEGGEILDIPIIRAQITIDPVTSGTLADGTIGYIRILRFESETVAFLDTALGSFDLASMTGLVLDLRNNPGGYMEAARYTASRFIDKDAIVYRMQDRISGERFVWSRGNSLPNLPLVVLVNRGSASASEITAGAIRDNNMGILVGETTYGKGVYQDVIRFGDGSALKITIGEYFTPSGRAVNGIGLAPDLAVEPDGDPLAVAIQWIQANAGTLMPIDLGTPPTPTP